MNDKKSWGSTVKGWFVVEDAAIAVDNSANPGETDRADADAIRRAAADPPARYTTADPSVPARALSFDEIFESGGIDAEERGRVTKTLELLQSLPPGTDEAVKKQIVMASLRAFGVPIDQIIEAAAQELQALDSYVLAGASDTEKVTQEADLRIKQFEEEIVKLRRVMQERVAEQQGVVRSCSLQKLEVQKVLEFFGQEAVARVVRESPKLEEPT